MNSELLPPCQELGINLVTSLGFQSITSVVALIRRIAEAGRPARIAYVSDYDPAGDGMPVAVSRQLEYWLSEYAPEADIKLTPIALTKQQVMEYRLPPIPIKETDLRRANFEARHGMEGAVELDALEALHPGTLARIVRDFAQPYRDRTLSRRLRQTERDASEAVSEEWSTEIADEAEQLEQVQDDAQAVLESYRARLEELRDAMDKEMRPIAERLDALRQAVQAKREEFRPQLPERPEPETGYVDEDDWLFASERDYMEQLEVYQARKNGQNLN
jgi:hypothetical protein